jgi:Putative translation factor (SUA5)
MAKIIEIHPQNPQNRLVRQVIDELHKGAVIVYPTDSGYALGTALGNKNGLERIRKIRHLSKHHDFTLMMRDLSHIGEYAKLDNNAFRLLKKSYQVLTPLFWKVREMCLSVYYMKEKDHWVTHIEPWRGASLTYTVGRATDERIVDY